MPNLARSRISSAYAAEHGLLVVSHDINTMPGHMHRRMEAGKSCAGLLMIEQSKPIRSVIDSLLLIWGASEAEEWHKQICFLPLAH